VRNSVQADAKLWQMASVIRTAKGET
jgi:hypothetical protein